MTVRSALQISKFELAMLPHYKTLAKMFDLIVDSLGTLVLDPANDVPSDVFGMP